MWVTFLFGYSYDFVMWVTFGGVVGCLVWGVLFFVRVFGWLVFVQVRGFFLETLALRGLRLRGSGGRSARQPLGGATGTTRTLTPESGYRHTDPPAMGEVPYRADPLS
jgi:hypothetical protein